MKTRFIIVALAALLSLMAGAGGATAGQVMRTPGSGGQPGAQNGQQQGAQNQIKLESSPETPIGSGFTYQGRLVLNGNPASGSYDFIFTLFDAATGGNQVGSPITILGQTLSIGTFTDPLDFGSSAFQGDARWLQIAVRPSGNPTYTILSPRQALTPAPYAMSLMPGAVINGNVSGSNGILKLNNSSGSGLVVQASGTGVFAQGLGAGVYGYTSFATGSGVFGEAEGTGSSNVGVFGFANSGKGVSGLVVSGTGVYGESQSTNGTGVFGKSNSGANAAGVSGSSTSGAGIVGTSTNGTAGVFTSTNGAAILATGDYAGISGTGVGWGVTGTSTGNNGTGVLGEASSPGGIGVRGQGGDSAAGIGVDGETTSSHPNSTGVFGFAPSGRGVFGATTSGYGLLGTASTGTAGVFTSTSGLGVIIKANYGEVVNSSIVGVSATADDGAGNGTGVSAGGGSTGVNASGGTYGVNATGGSYGVYSYMTSGTAAIYGRDRNAGGYFVGDANYGVYATSPSIGMASGGAWAGYFQGNIYVSGSCTGCLGTYQIDDPLDPANKYLNETGVASSEMLDLYTGHVTLDANGEAWVDMPAWFQSLNEAFDYQLTCVGGYAPVYVAQEIENNRFKIAGGKPGMKVSWQVTGTRHDPYAQAHSLQPEQDKTGGDKGKYLYPSGYGQPDSAGINYRENQPPQQPDPGAKP